MVSPSHTTIVLETLRNNPVETKSCVMHQIIPIIKKCPIVVAPRRYESNQQKGEYSSDVSDSLFRRDLHIFRENVRTPELLKLEKQKVDIKI